MDHFSIDDITAGPTWMPDTANLFLDVAPIGWRRPPRVGVTATRDHVISS